MSDLRVSDRVGSLDIFGIISPGVFILLTLTLFMVGLMNVFWISVGGVDFDKANAILKDWMLPLSVLGFFAAYLYGSVIRLFANDFAEILSGFYLAKLRRKNIDCN